MYTMYIMYNIYNEIYFTYSNEIFMEYFILIKSLYFNNRFWSVNMQCFLFIIRIYFHRVIRYILLVFSGILISEGFLKCFIVAFILKFC